MKKSISAYAVFQALLGLVVLEGIFANIFYFRSPSETQNAFLWGYSLPRLAIGIFSLFLLVIFAGIFILSFVSRDSFDNCLQRFIAYFASPVRRIVFLLPLAILLAFDLGINLVYTFPTLFNFAAFITVKRILLQQTGMVQIWIFLIPVQLWLFLITLKFLVFCLVLGRKEAGQQKLTLTARLALLFLMATATVVVLSLIWGRIFGNTWPLVLNGLTGKLAILALWFLIWFALEHFNVDWAKRYPNIFISISIWLVTFLVAAQVAQWMNALNTPFKNYWNWLADAYLHGRMYIIDPPSTGDMTLYNGNWYIPNPPLPAFLILPFIAIWGMNGFNTTLFSLILSSITSVLLYLILDELSRRKWIKLSHSGIIWLVALFSFGTVQMWLAISSVMWFFSHICVLLFAAAAFFFAVKRYPPWLSGLALGLALLGRPNAFALWPALFFITLQLQLEQDGKFSWKRMFGWSVWSALPVVFATGLLLYYNYLRFGNFLDFGYVNINGSARVVRLVQEYGMFNPYFIPINIRAMFLALPELKAKCDYYFPSGNGLTLIATTPAFIYALRRYKFSWWMLGCWISIFLSAALLLTYHNTGAVQISYRYVMDFVIPLIMVLAFTAGEKISIPLKLLIILSIIVNYYAIVSWYYGPC